MAGNLNQIAVEDYLKAIFKLAEWDVEAQTNADIAASLGVSTSSASEMIRKLTGMHLVAHEPYGPIELTPRGRGVALDMVRRHRLVETYLVQALAYSWDEVHEEAEVLEHAVSGKLIDRMDDMLGHPYRDPHGDPIPGRDGVVHQPVARPLAVLRPGEVGYVARIGDDDSDLLRWFDDHGVGLDTRMQVHELKPFGGPTVVRAGDDHVELGQFAVTALWVADDPALAPDETEGGGCPYVRCRHIG